MTETGGEGDPWERDAKIRDATDGRCPPKGLGLLRGLGPVAFCKVFARVSFSWTAGYAPSVVAVMFALPVPANDACFEKVPFSLHPERMHSAKRDARSLSWPWVWVCLMVQLNQGSNYTHVRP